MAVDDEEAIRRMYQRILTKFGYVVDCCESGEAFLARLKDQTPDLILLDMCLPGIDGLELLQLIKVMAPATPVLVVTGLNDVVQGRAALAAGASDYICKPLEWSRLHQTIALFLALKPVGTQGEKPA
jgi:DNA-binding response OmpR family regulator